MGQVFFVGAGPGSADLITLRGARVLARADVVLFDALTDPALRELAPQARWIDVGKRGFAHATRQTAINALLVRMARAACAGGAAQGRRPQPVRPARRRAAGAGRTRHRLRGGARRHRALAAAAAASQRPLTRRGRGRSVAFSTAMTQDGELLATRSADSEVFYMAGRQLGALSRRLRDAGWPADTPVCVVSRAGWSDQLVSEHQVDSLAQATVLHAGRPTVVTVGAAARAVAPQRQPAARDDHPAAELAASN